jgi:hypothetical protein
MAVLYSAIKSGKLQSYVERRAQAATGLQIRMGSLELDFPFGIQAKEISAGLPGKETQPLLSAEKLRVRTSLGSLLRRQLVFVEFVSPRISLTAEDMDFLKQRFPSGEGASGGFSTGLVRITNGDFFFAFAPVQARMENVNATFGASIFPSKKQALLLDVGKARLHIERAGQSPYDATLREFKSRISFTPSQTTVGIEGDAHTLATAGIPFFSLPPDIPVGISIKGDYSSHENSLQNAAFAVDLPPFREIRAYGSIADLTGTLAPNLTLAAEAPHIRDLVEYIEALKRPEYEGLKMDATVKLSGEIRGTIREPDISVRAEAADGAVQLNDLAMKGVNAAIPMSYKDGTTIIGPGVLDVDEASVPVGDQALAVSDIETHVSADSSSLKIEDAIATIRTFGKVNGRGSYEFASGRYMATASLHDVPSQKVIDFISTAAGKSRKNISLSGLLSVDCSLEGVTGEKSNQLKATFKSNLKEADFSPAASTRLAGVNAELEGSLSSDDPRNRWKFDMSGNSGKFTLKTASLEKAFSADRYPFSFSGTYDINKTRITGGAAAIDFGPLGKIKASGDIAFGSGKADLAFAVEKVHVQDLKEYISPAVYQLPEDMSLSGTADIKGRLNGVLLPSPKHLKGNFSLQIENGEFASGEFITAAGVAAQAQGSFATDSPADSWNFDFNGKAGGFELLIQTYYNSFKDSTFPFSLSAKYLVGERTLQDLRTKIGFADIGEASATGTARFGPKPVLDLQIRSATIDLNQLYEQVGQQVLGGSSPILKKARLGGRGAGEVAVKYDSEFWQAKGNLDITDGRFASGDDSLSVGSISVNLPFALHSPGKGNELGNEPSEFSGADFGKVRLKDIVLGPAQVGAIDLDVVLKENALYIKSPAPVEVLNGKLNLGEVRARDILSSSAEVKSSFSAEGINVEPISQAMGLPKIPGTINALFPNILLSRSHISTTGTAKVYAFEGAITIDSVGVEQPFSPVRTFLANLSFDDIRLLQLTDVLKFGTITGVLEGTVKGLEISQGQPAAFVADFETVERRGVPQTINFDAVENISILGTGTGFPATIGRGIFSFVDEFRYGKIGFYTTLKNDNFRLRGKVVRDSTEYFVRGVFFGPSINVINRNPGQTVSFKSMLERISRIHGSQENKDQESNEKR